MTEPRPLTVLVLAVGGNVSQGILKSLDQARAGLRILGADISPPQAGLFAVDRAFVSPWAADPDFIPWLLDCCRKESVDAIMSGAEPVLMVLARNRAAIEGATGARCLVSDADVMELGDDKLKTCHWLRERGFNGPAFAPADDPAATRDLVQKCGFPLVAKPRRAGGSRGLLLVENTHDLEYVARKTGYLLQEYVGDEGAEYTVGCFRKKDGTLAQSCCMRRDLLCGTTYRAELGDFPEIRAQAEDITRALQPMGPCNIQLRLHNGLPVCFEINPRLSGSAPIRAHFGYNEARATLDHYVLDREPHLPRVTSGVGLRYWNELYPDPRALEELQRTGALQAPWESPPHLEDWGMRRPGDRREAPGQDRSPN